MSSADPVIEPLSQAGASGQPTEDHRVRVARQRREKMRALLLQSVLSVSAGKPSEGPAVIDDVIRHAGVSRGTFYKYFDSLEQAVSELGLRMADEMTAGIYSVYDVLEEPLMRTSTGFQMFLIRAVLEPDWGGFISHIGLLNGESLIRYHIQEDLRSGIEAGDYDVPSVEVATDLLMGAKLEAIQRIIRGEGDRAYVRDVTFMVLRALGVSSSKAIKSVDKAYQRLCTEAPGKVGWWKAIP